MDEAMELTPEQKARLLAQFTNAEKELIGIYNKHGVLAMHEHVSSIVGAYMVVVGQYMGMKGVEIAAMNLELVIDGARRGTRK